MAETNLGWGAPRIHGELLKLGIAVSERSVSRLMPKTSTAPSQTWRTLLDNYVHDIASIGFFTVATVRLRVLCVFIVLSHESRRFVHFSVTEHPTAAWTAQQIVEAFPEDQTPRFVIRDRDGVYDGESFQHRVQGMGIREVLTAPRSPWQNPCAERLIGSIRRECLDHVIVFNSRHLRRVLKSYFYYYHRSRTQPWIGQGFTGTTRSTIRRIWSHSFQYGSRRTASPIRTPGRVDSYFEGRQLEVDASIG